MFRRFAPSLAPKSFRFKDPDTNQEFGGTSIQDVAAKVRAYRMQNELPELIYLEAVIENYLCRQPENLGGCERLPKLKRGVMEYLKGSIVILKSMLYDSFKSQEEADARAAVCLTCPLNTFYEESNFDSWCDEVAEDVVGERKSKYHKELGICSGCNCCLRFKVWYNEPIKLTKKQEKVITSSAPNCWQLNNV